LIRGLKCAARLYVLLHADSDKTSIRIAYIEHVHENIEKTEMMAVKEKVRELFNNNVTKPKTILHKLREFNMKERLKTTLGK
jgi:hypothetical protein